MTDAILTHDAGVSAFDGASGVVSTSDDDGEVSFNWDEQHIVNVDAPADLEGAFDTERFYKIDGATIARPIKQPYLVGDELEVYKKPADELKQAAWSFDNAPYTIKGHPNSGMVKNVDDIHGFWRNPRYDEDEDRLKEDLYIPASDSEALEFIEEHGDVSVGFYNRVASDYDGDTGDLAGDDVDGFQVQMYGDHIAGVEQGRCSGEDGCGLDSDDSHGVVVDDNVETHNITDYNPDSSTDDCGCGGSDDNGDSNMADNDNDFDIPDLSVDAIAEQNDAISELKEERDNLREEVDEMESEIKDALDTAENFSVELSDDECVCDAVEDLVSDLDEKAEEAREATEEVEDLQDDLKEYREDERKEALDTLSELGADTDEYEDDDLEAIEEEIDRRKEVLESADADVSVKGTEDSTETDTDTESQSGPRTFGRGHAANAQ